MSVRNAFALFLALSTLALLAGCGSGSGITNPVAPPSGGFSNSDLNGTYVFSVSGIDSNGFPYAVMGTLTANGSGGNGRGGISGGTLDINDSDTVEFTSGPIAGASINSNSYYNVSVDGRGQATMGTNISGFPNITLDFVLSSSSHGLITEFDTFGSGSGTLDLQAAGVSPSGSYAFSLSGANYTSGTPWATVGNFAYSGGDIAGLEDLNEGGLLAYADQPLTGALVLGPSAAPATTLATGAFSGLFDVVAIDATHLKFIEMDETATLSGDAYSQTSATIPANTMAYTLTGEGFAAGGFITTDGSGGISGVEDYNDSGTVSSPSAPAIFTANDTAAGTGRYTLGSFANFVGGSSYAAYPSSGGLLLLEIDTSGITVGAAYPQSTTTFGATSQGYGLNLTGINLGGATGSAEEVDDIAEFTASASTGGTGALTAGIIDENYDPGGSPIFDIGLSDATYGAIDSVGRYQLTATAGNSSSGTLNGGFLLTFYAVDGTTFPFIESDGGQVATGFLVLQTSSSATPGLAQSRSRMFVTPRLIRSRAASSNKK